MAIEIVDLPTQNGDVQQQTVSLPEGIHPYANHGAGIEKPTFARRKSPSFVGKLYQQHGSHMGYKHVSCNPVIIGWNIWKYQTDTDYSFHMSPWLLSSLCRFSCQQFGSASTRQWYRLWVIVTPNSLLGKHWNEGWCKHRISLFYPAQQVLDDYWILLASPIVRHVWICYSSRVAVFD